VSRSRSNARAAAPATAKPVSLGRRVLPAVLIAGVSGALLTQLDHPVALASGGQAGGVPAGGAKAGAGTAGAGTGAAAPVGGVAGGSKSADAGSTSQAPSTSSGTTAPAPGTLPPTVPRRVPVQPQPGQGGGNTGGGPSPSVAPSAQPPVRRIPGQQPGQTPGAASAPTTAVAAACTGTTTDGPSVDTRFGPVQVAATISSDGKLCDVKALVTPSSHRRSVQINNFAVPVLHDRAIAAQGSDFNAVSGATLTSDAYATSLQSILDHR